MLQFRVRSAQQWRARSPAARGRTRTGRRWTTPSGTSPPSNESNGEGFIRGKVSERLEGENRFLTSVLKTHLMN